MIGLYNLIIKYTRISDRFLTQLFPWLFFPSVSSISMLTMSVEIWSEYFSLIWILCSSHLHTWLRAICCIARQDLQHPLDSLCSNSQWWLCLLRCYEREVSGGSEFFGFLQSILLFEERQSHSLCADDPALGKELVRTDISSRLTVQLFFITAPVSPEDIFRTF
jgi:hypothetical protein